MKTRRHSSEDGFTLIEMVITICVFLLLAGAIFGIFGATLQSANTLQFNQCREDETQALASWLRHSFLMLPVEGRVISYHREDSPLHVSGIIWGTGNDLQALDFQAQANGNYTMRLATYGSVGNPGIPHANDLDAISTFKSEVLDKDSSLAWRPLMRDLKAVEWQFRLLNITEWTESATEPKPVLAQLTFQMAGMTGDVVDDFWIPPVLPAGNPALPVSTVGISANP